MKTTKHKYEILRVRSNERENPQGENPNYSSFIRFIQLFSKVHRERMGMNKAPMSDQLAVEVLLLFA